MQTLGDEIKKFLSAPVESGGDEEIPPVDSCVYCAQPSCQGDCRERGEAKLPQAPVGLVERALLLTVETRKQFGAELPDEPRAALRFAVVAEGLAVGSYVLPITLAALASDSGWAERLATLRSASLLAIVFTALVVVLHLLWGASLELGLWLSGRSSDASRGVSFSGYTCGFDLLTSPFGLVWLLARGDVQVGLVLKCAIAAPRPAMQAYLSEARRLDPGSIRAAERGAWVGFSLGIAALIVGVAYGTWLMLVRELGA